MLADVRVAHIDLKRFVAALLPFFYLWAFVACVSICEQKTLAAHGSSELSSLNEIHNVADCDGCPLSYFPKATTPERAKSLFAVASSPSLAPQIPTIYSAQPDTFSDRLSSSSVNVSPPLNLLSPLRI